MTDQRESPSPEDGRRPAMPGNGSMQRCIAGFDWATTRLGPRNAWPPVLEWAAGLLWGTPHPTALLWGPSAVLCYNDGFCSLLGEQHPAALGQAIRDGLTGVPFLPVHWIDQVQRTGCPIRRSAMPIAYRRGSGHLDGWFDITVAPLPGNGEVGGVLVSLWEVTAASLAERRAATLRQLGRLPRTASAERLCVAAAETLAENSGDLPFALLYLATEDGRQARLAAAAGLGSGISTVPAVIDLSGSEPAAERSPPLGDLGDATAHWPEPRLRIDFSRPALIQPLPATAGTTPRGYLVAGINERLALDETYLGFVELIAGQIALRLGQIPEPGHPPAAGAGQPTAPPSPATAITDPGMLVLERAPEAIFSWQRRPDGSERIVYANPALTDVVGVPPAAVADSLDPLLALVNSEDLERLRHRLETSVADQAPWQVEFRLAHPRKGDCWIEGSGSPFPEPDGGLTWHGCLHDITDRKRAAAQLRRTNERLALVQRSAGIGTWEWDFRTGTHQWSRELFDLLGLDPEDTEPSLEAWRKVVHPDDLAAADACLALSIDGNRPLNTDYRVVLADDRVRWLHVVGDTLEDAAGGAVCMSGICLDVTARKEAEEALRESDRRKDQFLAILAHELRNPLAPIRNGLRILRRSADDPALQAETLTMMDRQIQHLVRLVDDLLDLSRVNRNRISLRREPTELQDAIEDAVATCRVQMEAAGQKLHINLPRRPMVLGADPTRLAQIFAILLDNASKFSPAGAAIEVRGRQKDGHAVVSIKDHGVGIPSAHLARIFESFTQVDRSLEKDKGGLGIGLSLARELTALHGGTIEARSDGPGRGSEFIVRLPLAADADPRPTPRAVVGAPGSDRLRVLVVDDNLDAVASLATLIGIQGHEVRIAHDGREAVETAEEYQPELILMDIGMPRLNGFDACSQIRKQPWARDILIAALTGWGLDEDLARSREAGFDHHLVKPVDPEAVERLLAEAASRRATRASGAVSRTRIEESAP